MKRCTFEGCDKPHRGKGLCSAHLSRLRRHGDPAHGGPLRGQHPAVCTFPECGRESDALGLCVGHYTQQIRGHELTKLRADIDDEERFFSHVTKTDTCWLWDTTPRWGKGYGYFRPTGGEYIGAHRWSYEHANGPRGPGEEDLVVDHICFVRRCVNPDHLQLLTRSANAARQQRALSDTCAKGHLRTPENTYLYTRKDGSVERKCAECTKKWQRDNYAKKGRSDRR